MKNSYLSLPSIILIILIIFIFISILSHEENVRLKNANLDLRKQVLEETDNYCFLNIRNNATKQEGFQIKTMSEEQCEQLKEWCPSIPACKFFKGHYWLGNWKGLK